MQRLHKMPFILCLAALCLFTVIKGRAVSRIDDVLIDTRDDKFICDKIECPNDAAYCVVTKHKEFEKSTVMIRTNTCYLANKKVLKESEFEQTVNANSYFDFYIEANRNGHIIMGDYYGSNIFDLKKFNRHMDEFHSNLKSNMAHMNRGINRMNYKLNHMFDFW